MNININDNNKLIYIMLVVIGVSILLFLGYNLFFQEEKGSDFVSDTVFFKTEYESYNDKTLYDVDSLDVFINEDVIINIKTIDEIVEIMQEEDALIYFGFPTCKWCRNMVESLVDTAVSNDQEIYYVDISTCRNKYEFIDGNLVETVEGEPGYYDVIDFLSEVLESYEIVDDDGDSHDTETKRLYAPTVVTVKNGELLDIHIGTLDSIDDPFSPLLDDEYDQLCDLFDSMISDLQIMLCEEEVC